MYGVDTKEGGRLGCSSGQADQKGEFGTDATASQPKTRIIICLGGRSSVAQPRLGVHIRSPESLCVQLFSPLPALGRGKEERVSVSVSERPSVESASLFSPLLTIAIIAVTFVLFFVLVFFPFTFFFIYTFLSRG